MERGRKHPRWLNCEETSIGTGCYDKHALRADAPIPRMFFSPLVL